MEFEWDEEKNQQNIRKHGYSFLSAPEVFLGPVVEYLDDRFDYGEERWVALGRLRLDIVAVVFTERGERYRIISMRRATKQERAQNAEDIENYDG